MHLFLFRVHFIYLWDYLSLLSLARRKNKKTWFRFGHALVSVLSDPISDGTLVQTKIELACQLRKTGRPMTLRTQIANSTHICLEARAYEGGGGGATFTMRKRLLLTSSELTIPDPELS